tara:strand:- start:405 stop:656 length:252 start_codon:yes stop_codon:yes gene_type:complete
MKATYNYNRTPYTDTGKSKIKLTTCNYWEVPAYPTCSELLKVLIEESAKLAEQRLELSNANQLRRDRMTATLKKKRELREKND